MFGHCFWRTCRPAAGGEYEVFVADRPGGSFECLVLRVQACHLRVQKVAAVFAESFDREADAVRVDAAYGYLVDQGYKRVLRHPVYEQGLSGASQGRWQVSQEAGAGKAGADHHDPGSAVYGFSRHGCSVFGA